MEQRIEGQFEGPPQSASIAPVTAPMQGQGSTTSRAAVEAIFRHQRILLWTAASVFVITALYVLFVPRTYQSEMNILVRNARPDYLISPEKSNGTTPLPDVTEEKINSEIEVLKSKDVADTVVDANWASKPLNQRTQAEIKTHEKLILEYTKHLSIDLLRKSNVIRVTYTGNSPRAAQDTLTQLLETFLAKQREIERSTGASTFFATEAQRYKAELDQAQQQLAGYQQQMQIVSLPDKEATLESQIAELESQARATQVAITEATNRISAGQSQLRTIPSRMSTSERAIPNTYTVEQLTTLLANLQNQRTAALVKFLPSDRMVLQLDKQIADTTASLKKATEDREMENTTDANPVHQQVRSGVAQATTELRALNGRLASQQQQLAALRNSLSGVEGSTVDYTTLQSKVAELQNNYQLYTQKHNEAEIADAMDRQNLVNVAVAERPTFTSKPFRPDPVLDISLGGFTAIFLAVCMVFFAEVGRDTVAAPYELEALTRIPVLATVPLLEGGYGNSLWGETSPRTPSPRRDRDPSDSPGSPDWNGNRATAAPQGFLPPKPAFAYDPSAQQAASAPAAQTQPAQAEPALLQAAPTALEPAAIQPQPTVIPVPRPTARPIAAVAPSALQAAPAEDDAVEPPMTAAAAWFAKVKSESGSIPTATPVPTQPAQPVAQPQPTPQAIPAAPPAEPLQSEAPQPPPIVAAPAPVMAPAPVPAAPTIAAPAPQPSPAPRKRPVPWVEITDLAPAAIPSIQESSNPVPQESPMLSFFKSKPTSLNLDSSEASPIDHSESHTQSVQQAAPPASRPSRVNDPVEVIDPIPRYVAPPRPSQIRRAAQPIGIERPRLASRELPTPVVDFNAQTTSERAIASAARRLDSAVMAKPKFYAEDIEPVEPVAHPKAPNPADANLLANSEAEPTHRPSSQRLAAIRDEISGNRPRLSPSQRLRARAEANRIANGESYYKYTLDSGSHPVRETR